MIPKRTQYSREELPLGAISTRDAGNGQVVRMVKVRMDGPPARRWIQFARWWWEQSLGPVPAGKRICHADGNLLNDEPSNLVALTAGEVFNLYHKLRPEMSRANHAACGRSAAVRNVETARIRRKTLWLPGRWYGVDFRDGRIHNRPRRSRWMVYRDHGFADRLADRLKREVTSARAGDIESAAWVMNQVAKLENYWRWIRSSSLGWPGLNCMSACILAVLADAGGSLNGSAVLAQVRQMRTLFDWRPHVLQPGVFHTCVSTLRGLVITTRRGRAEAIYQLTPKAIADRVDSPRIVPIRGCDLSGERFVDFEKVESSTSSEVAA